jgi:hypothetical protein
MQLAYGVVPPEIIERLNKEINAALADPKIKARLANLGGMVLVDSSTDFGRLTTTSQPGSIRPQSRPRARQGQLTWTQSLFTRLFANDEATN